MCLKSTGEYSYVSFQCINKGAHNAQEDSLGNVTFLRVLSLSLLLLQNIWHVWFWFYPMANVFFVVT